MEDFNKIIPDIKIKRTFFDRFIIWVMGSKIATVLIGGVIVYLLLSGILFNFKLIF